MNNSNEVKRTKGEWESSIDHSREAGAYPKTLIKSNGHLIGVCYKRSWDIGHVEAEANAEFICKAVNEYDKLKEDNAALLDALKSAVNVIKDWNGGATFDIYYDHAPEMKLIRETLLKAERF